ncbi:MAG: hypothetical protein D3916_07990 [Candidatus Electrothrix sp. MAN1_4]|nr:hypothetical protein [Candidatus Electrothrix sp. MAN1_4]
MMFRENKLSVKPGLTPNFIMITVLKGAFTAVSALPAGKINSVKDFSFLPNDRLISDELNGTSAHLFLSYTSTSNTGIFPRILLTLSFYLIIIIIMN